MTLGEYLNENTDIKNFCILMLTDKDCEYKTIKFKNTKNVDKELMNCEFMEANEDDGILGIWIR